MTRIDLPELRYPWETPPAEGEVIEVAEGILWIRLPLPMALDHINIYALDDGDSWTLVDTGLYSRRTVAIWEHLLAGPLAGKPVGRILLTHCHPDHVGMAGWFMEKFGTRMETSQTSWIFARMLILDVEEAVTPQAQIYWRGAGLPADLLAKRLSERPYNFADTCHPLPTGYTRLRQGDVIHAAGRDWDVHIGNGHAPEHLTFWSREDALVLAGDQILPSISPNIGVYPGEPGADPLSEWLESCARLSSLARDDQLVLCGHNRPFTGLPFRMKQLADNHIASLPRLLDLLKTPRRAYECFPVLFRRQIDERTVGLAIAETYAHLNYLLKRGDITREVTAEGVWLWQTKP